MTSHAPQAFAAELLERSAAGMAGLAANLFLERHPEVRERFGPDPLGAWKSHLNQRVLELAAALHSGEPRLFTARVLWTAKAYEARGQDMSDVHRSLEALRDTLAQRLPEPARAGPIECLEQAMGGLSAGAPVDAAALDAGKPAERLALQYLQTVLEGDAPGAIRHILAAVDKGLDRKAAYLDVLLAAQREIGRLWHAGEVNVAEEHLVTATTERVMAILANSAKPVAANGLTAVIAAVSSNAHDIGLRALADLYQMDGWRSLFLGANVPANDLPEVLAYFQADLLLLGATMLTHIPRVEEAIAAIRTKSDRPVGILVGGAAFDEAPELWQRLGADGYAATAEEALRRGREIAAARSRAT